MSGLNDEQFSRFEALSGKSELDDAEMAELEQLDAMTRETEPQAVAPSWGFSTEDISTEVATTRAAEAEAARVARNTRLRLAFEESRRTSDDDASTTVAISKQLNVPFDTVRANLPAFRETAAAANFDPDAWATQNPELAKLVTENPQLGPLVMRSKEAGPIVRALRAAGDFATDVLGLMSEEDIAAEEQFAADFANDPDAAMKRGEKLEQDARVRKELARAKRDAPRQVLERDDARAQLLRDDSSFASKALVVWQRGVEAKRALDLSRRQVRLMLAENGSSLAGDPVELAAELADAKLANTPRAFGDDAGLLRDLTEGVEGVVSTVDVAGDALKGMGAAGAVGFVAGAGVTGAVTKSPALAIESGMAGARVLGGKGATAAAFLSATQLEMGASYETLRELRTDANQRLTPGEAMGGAVIQGLAKGALEVISLGQQGKVLRQALPSRITGLLQRDPTFRALVGRVATEYSKSVATEGFTEGLQDAVEQVGDYVQASMKDEALQKKGYDADRGFAAVQGGVMGALLSGSVTSGMVLATSRSAEAQAEMQERAVGPLLELATTPAVQAAPQEFAQLVAETTGQNGAPLTALHVDAGAVVRFFQERGDDADTANATLAELLGPDAPAQLAEAAAAGGKLEVPMVAVLSKWGASEVGKAMVGHTTTDASALTPEQRKVQQPEIEARAEAIVAETEAAQREAELVTQRTQQLEQQLLDAGIGKQQAKAGAALVRAFMVTQAKDFDTAVSELFPEAPISVAKGDEKPVGAEALAQPQSDADVSLSAVAESARLGFDQGPEARARAAFFDALTGLRNKAGFARIEEARKGAPGVVVALTTTDAKPLNKVSHDQTDRLFQAIAPLLQSIDPEAGRSGTNFVLRGPSLKSVQQLIDAWQQHAPGMRDVRFVLGAADNYNDALAELGDEVEAGRAKGRQAEGVAPELFDAELLAERPDARALPASREGTALDLGEASPLREPSAFGQTRPLERATPEADVNAAAEKFPTAESFAAQEYFDSMSGGLVLNKRGFEAVGPKKWVAALDGIGLKKLNAQYARVGVEQLGLSRREAERFGRMMGDQMLKLISEKAHDMGGMGVAFARLSGDEYAAKHDDRAVLEQFVDDLFAELEVAGVDVELEDGTTVTITAGLRSQIGEESYERAEKEGEVREGGRRAGADSRSRADLRSERAGRADARGIRSSASLGPRGRPGEVPGAVGEGSGSSEEVTRLKQDDLQAVLDSARAASVKLDVRETHVITISRIVVPETDRGRGIGSKVMRDLMAYADRVGKPLALTPSADFGGSVARLRKFYKRLGFIENTGRGRLQSVNESMVRPAPPGSPVVFQDDGAVPKGYTSLPAGRALQSTIRVFLNKSADVSTVIHEAGHAFLEHLADLAERPDAPQRTKDTYAAALKALGVESRREVKREHHEKFARAFERYTFEGEAPSGELKRVFARFTSWLVGIYRTLAGIPGAELSAELKPVFDAMLATDDQLAAMRRKQGPQLTAEQLQVKQAERQAQLEQEADEYREGSHAAQLAAVKDKLRAREKWWKDGLKKLEANFADEYEQLPARRAQRFLSGEETGEPIVLDRALVQEVIGELRVPGMKTAEAGGVRPSVVAEMAGYASPRAMLAELAGLRSKETWVRAQADAEMRRLHPGILDDLSKFRAMLADGLRGATEKRLMREVAGLEREALKRAAAKLVERRKVGKLQPGKALAQQRHAANAKARAMAKGDANAVRQAATAELLNHYLHAELTKAVAEVERVEALAKRLGKKSARERLGKASPAYRDAVDFIRGELGFSEQTDLDDAALEAAVGQLEGDAVTIGDPDWLAPLRAAIAKTGDYRELTVAELGAIRDALKMLDAGARQRNEVLVDGKRVDFEQVKADVLKEIASTLPERGPVVSEHQKTVTEKIRSKLSALDGFLLTPIDLVRDLTGDNPDTALHRALVNTMRRAQGLEADLLEQRVKPVLEAIDAMPAEVRAGLNDAIDGRAMFPGHRKDVETPRKRYELLGLALNAGSESSRGVLLEGRGISEGEFLAALNTLSKEEIDFVNAVHASLEQLREPAFDLEERETGIRPRAVEALPTNLKNGRLTGGYYPLKAEPEASTVGARQFGEDQLASLFDPTFSRPSTSHGHLKSRTGAVYPLSLDLDVMRKHLTQVAHDLAFRESVKSAARLIMDPDVQRELTARLGPEKTKEFLLWLKDIGGASGLQSTPADGIMSFFKKNLSTSALSGLSTAVGNFANLAAAVTSTKLKSKHLAAGIGQVMAAPWDMLRGTSTVRERMLELSGVARAESSELVQQLQGDLQSIRSGPLSRASRKFAESGLFAMRAIDGIVSTAVWTGAHRQALAEGKDAGAAVRFADDVLLRVQPSKAIAEKSRILRDKGTWIGTATIFYSYLNVAYRAQHRLAAPLFTQEFRSASSAKKATMAAKVAGNLLAFYVAVQVLGDLGMGRGPEAGDADDEEPDNQLLKWRNWFVRKVAVAPLSLVPVLPLTSLAEGWLLDKQVSPRAEPTSAALFQAFKLARALKKEEVTEREILKASLPLVGAFTGAPTRLIDVTGLYLWDTATGESDATNAGRFIGGVMYGEKENQPLNLPAALGDLTLE